MRLSRHGVAQGAARRPWTERMGGPPRAPPARSPPAPRRAAAPPHAPSPSLCRVSAGAVARRRSDRRRRVRARAPSRLDRRPTARRATSSVVPATRPRRPRAPPSTRRCGRRRRSSIVVYGAVDVGVDAPSARPRARRSTAHRAVREASARGPGGAERLAAPPEADRSGDSRRAISRDFGAARAAWTSWPRGSPASRRRGRSARVVRRRRLATDRLGEGRSMAESPVAHRRGRNDPFSGGRPRRRGAGDASAEAAESIR